MADKEAVVETPTPIIGTGIARLVNSTKGIVVIAALAMVTYLASRGVFTAEQALDFAKWMIGLYLAAVAVEDGARKFGAGRVEATRPALQVAAIGAQVVRLRKDVEKLKAPSEPEADDEDEDDEDDEE
jgi:hypothetical protein